MNIFGTAGSTAGPNTGTSTSGGASKFRKFRQNGDEERPQEGSNTNKGNGRLDHYFGSEKGTGMRLSYRGAGAPSRPICVSVGAYMRRCVRTQTPDRSDEGGGPTATCSITTFEPEPQLELPFGDETCVRPRFSPFCR